MSQIDKKTHAILQDIDEEETNITGLEIQPHYVRHVNEYGSTITRLRKRVSKQKKRIGQSVAALTERVRDGRNIESEYEKIEDLIESIKTLDRSVKKERETMLKFKKFKLYGLHALLFWTKSNVFMSRKEVLEDEIAVLEYEERQNEPVKRKSPRKQSAKQDEQYLFEEETEGEDGSDCESDDCDFE